MANVSGSVIQVDEAQVRGHVEEVVRSSVAETLNGLLQAKCDQLCQASRYERSADRVDTRAGSYDCKTADQGRRGHTQGTPAAKPAV